MNRADCDPLAFTTAVNTLAVSVAAQLKDEELELLAAVLTQLGDTLATIAVQRSLCGQETGE
jgi:deferrochelatase/peroxidase EfeB